MIKNYYERVIAKGYNQTPSTIDLFSNFVRSSIRRWCVDAGSHRAEQTFENASLGRIDKTANDDDENGAAAAGADDGDSSPTADPMISVPHSTAHLYHFLALLL